MLRQASKARAADAFSREKVRLESIGQPIEDFDLLIGITARENDLAVVTHNTKHFCRIEGLKTAQRIYPVGKS